MKQTEKFIVFRDKENGRFLNEYKNKVDNQSKAKMLFDALDDIFGGDD